MGRYTVNEGKTFEPLKEDKYQVEIYGAEPYTGTEYQSTIPQEQVKFTFVILDEDKTCPENGVEVPVRGRRLWDQTTTVFSPVGSTKPTKLTQITAAVFGHELAPEEVAVFEEADLIGKQLCVMVGKKIRTDKSVGNKILSFSPADKQLPKYDDSDFGDGRKAEVKKSQPAIAPDDFEKEMDAEAAKTKNK